MKRVKLVIDGDVWADWYTPLDLTLSSMIVISLGRAIFDAIRYSELIYTPPWSPGLLVSVVVDAAFIADLLLVRWAHRVYYRRARNQETMWRRM